MATNDKRAPSNKNDSNTNKNCKDIDIIVIGILTYAPTVNSAIKTAVKTSFNVRERPLLTIRFALLPS